MIAAAHPWRTVPTIRPREESDLAELAVLLRRDQPLTQYPINLPADLKNWIRGEPVLAAFVAEVEGEIRGHVSVREAELADDGDGKLLPLWSSAHRAPIERCAAVSRLFTDSSTHGQGVGAALVRTAVDFMRDARLHPCLDVLPLEGPRSAVGFYARHGWVEAGRVRASWLRPQWPDLVAMVLPEDG